MISATLRSKPHLILSQPPKYNCVLDLAFKLKEISKAVTGYCLSCYRMALGLRTLNWTEPLLVYEEIAKSTVTCWLEFPTLANQTELFQIPKGWLHTALIYKEQMTIFLDIVSHLENEKLGMSVNKWPKKKHI